SNTGTDVIVACNSYTWIDGNTYTSSNNTATHTLQNQYGCDSVVTLNLTIHNVTSESFTTNACNSYTWQGKTYTQSGIYHDTITNAKGCDSLMTLNLNIFNSSNIVQHVEACSSYTWINGITYINSVNNVSHTLQTINGCDSIVYLNLTISP